MSNIITKPSIYKEIAVYNFKKLDRETAHAFCQNLDRHRSILRSLKVRGVVLSLPRLIEAVDFDALPQVADRLSALQREMMIVNGFMDYPVNVYDKMASITAPRGLCLFYNIEIASLAIGTLNKPLGSMIVLFSPDDEEVNLSYSRLVSQRFFVIKARNNKDFMLTARKYKNQAVLVNYSHFGGLHDDIDVQFLHGVYIYKVRGMLTDSLCEKFNLAEHIKRLKSSHKIFVFELSKMSAMDLKAARFFARIQKDSESYEARICFVGYDEHKVILGAQRVLDEANIWAYTSMEHLYGDQGIQHILASRKTISGDGKKGLTPHLVLNLRHILSGTLDTLRVYGHGKIEKDKVAPIRFHDIISYNSIAITMVTFQGDVEGTLFFMFDQHVTDMLVSSMMGEDPSNVDMNVALDAMQEFVNAVAGSVKTALSQNNTSTTFDIPHSTQEKHSLTQIIGDKWGVHIAMRIEKETFHAFLSPISLSRI